MIHTNRIVTVGEQECIIDRPIVLYRGDREVEIEFTLVGNEFTFSEEGNVIKSVNASHGQLVLNTPSGEHMFSELAECHEGKVVFVVTKEMIDEFIEMGFYSFQIRLYDSAEMKSRVTIPPVMNGFDIRNPIAAEDETNVVDQGIVDYARIFKDQSNEELPTFTWDGEYVKTEWVHHDVITENKLNKIEDALYSINANIKESDVVMLNTLDQVKKDADKYVKEHMAEVEVDVDEFERNLNTDVQKFKVDTNAAMTAHKNEVSEELESVNLQLTHIAKMNIKDFGAIGDGVNDDTEAIQRAIDSIKDVGGTVYFPKCSNYYKITNNIILYSNICIEGDISKPYIRYDGTGVISVFDIKNTENIAIKNISIYNGGASYGNHLGLNSNGIYIYNSQNIEINNCYITEIGGFSGVTFRKSKGLKVLDTDFYKCTYAMLHLGEETEDILVDRCTFDTVTTETIQNAYTICTGASDYDNEYSFLTRKLRIFNSKLLNNPRWEGIDTHGCLDLQICNNYIENVQTGIMACFDVRPKVPFEHGDIIISNNIIKKGNSTENGNGIVVQGNENGTGEYAEHVVISNNVILGRFGDPDSTYRGGINLVCLKYVTINDNIVDGCMHKAFIASGLIHANIFGNAFLNTHKPNTEVLMPVRFLTGCWLVSFKNNVIKNNIDEPLYRGVYCTNKGLAEYDGNIIVNASDAEYHTSNAIMSGKLNSDRIGKRGFYVKDNTGSITYRCVDEVIRSIDQTLSLTANSNGTKTLVFDGPIANMLCPGQEIILVGANNGVDVTTVVRDIVNHTTIEVIDNISSNTNITVKTTESTWVSVNEYAESLVELERNLSIDIGTVPANSMITVTYKCQKTVLNGIHTYVLMPLSSLNGLHYTYSFAMSSNEIIFRIYNPNSRDVTINVFNFSLAKIKSKLI